MYRVTARDTISYETSEDLPEAIETEPYAGSEALFLTCIPLRCKERKAWRDCGLEQA